MTGAGVGLAGLLRRGLCVVLAGRLSRRLKVVEADCLTLPGFGGKGVASSPNIYQGIDNVLDKKGFMVPHRLSFAHGRDTRRSVHTMLMRVLRTVILFGWRGRWRVGYRAEVRRFRFFAQPAIWTLGAGQDADTLATEVRTRLTALHSSPGQGLALDRSRVTCYWMAAGPDNV